MSDPSAANPLDRIFNARSVAFVGASNKATTMGTIQMLNTLKSTFAGPVIPIHPKANEVLGQKAYPSLRDLPEPVDLAVLIVPTKAVISVVEDAIARGIKHLVITTAGFREVDDEGRRNEEHLVELGRKHDLRFVGPNCIGVINAHSGLNTTFFPYRHQPGPLGLASQSGTYVTQTLDLLARWGIGLSKGISIGNAASIDLADALDFFAEDEKTRAVAMYIEGVSDGRRFFEAARRCAAIKPVVALYVGGTESGARSGASHTGALAGPDALYEGLLRQAGVIRARSVADLYQWGWALATQPVPKGRRMAILTHSGGPATSMADAVERTGMRLPRLSDSLQKKIRKLIPHTGSATNPIDLTFNLDPKLLNQTLPEMLLESGEVDGLLMHGLQGSSFFEGVRELAGDLVDLDVEQLTSFTSYMAQPLFDMAQRMDKPIVMSAFYDRQDNVVRALQDHHVPVFDMPERAVAAMAALVRYGELRKRTAS